MRSEREFYRDLVIAFAHPDVDDPLAYLRRHSKREGWA